MGWSPASTNGFIKSAYCGKRPSANLLKIVLSPSKMISNAPVIKYLLNICGINLREREKNAKELLVLCVCLEAFQKTCVTARVFFFCFSFSDLQVNHNSDLDRTLFYRVVPVGNPADSKKRKDVGAQNGKKDPTQLNYAQEFLEQFHEGRRWIILSRNISLEFRKVAFQPFPYLEKVTLRTSANTELNVHRVRRSFFRNGNAFLLCH